MAPHKDPPSGQSRERRLEALENSMSRFSDMTLTLAATLLGFSVVFLGGKMVLTTEPTWAGRFISSAGVWCLPSNTAGNSGDVSIVIAYLNPPPLVHVPETRHVQRLLSLTWRSYMGYRGTVWILGGAPIGLHVVFPLSRGDPSSLPCIGPLMELPKVLSEFPR